MTLNCHIDARPTIPASPGRSALPGSPLPISAGGGRQVREAVAGSLGSSHGHRIRAHRSANRPALDYGSPERSTHRGPPFGSATGSFRGESRAPALSDPQNDRGGRARSRPSRDEASRLATDVRGSRGARRSRDRAPGLAGDSIRSRAVTAPGVESLYQ